MDPVTLSTAFATIVGLLSDFNASRQGLAAASIEEFKAWLASNRHADIVSALEQNAATLVSVKALLHEDRESLASKLEQLDKHLARLATGFEPFKALAQAAHPGIELSDQALSILRQIDAAGASRFLKGNMLSEGAFLACVNGSGAGTIQLSEPRFLDSDLSDLQELRLIQFVGTNGNHDPVYAFTRNAAALLKTGRP